MNYKTIKAFSFVEFTEKRSKFIGFCTPVLNEEEAIFFINSIKEKHREATHNVYAYSLRENNLARFSDDGEPSGTAGLPILNIIKKEGLADCAIVVTRYFGGTKLGTGGLVRAYSEAASLAIKKSGISFMQFCDIIEIRCEYAFYDTINSLLFNAEAKLMESDFSENVKMVILIKQENTKFFAEAMKEMSGGRIEALITGQKYFSFE